MEVDKFINAEQQAKLDEEAKIEEEKKLAAKGDNARERALDMMMGGVLEIKKEDELKKVMIITANCFLCILCLFVINWFCKCTKSGCTHSWSLLWIYGEHFVIAPPYTCGLHTI